MNLDLQPVQQTTLQDALDAFNEAFDRPLKLPMTVEFLEMAADFAELRGRHDVATDLRTALKDALNAGNSEEVLK